MARLSASYLCLVGNGGERSAGLRGRWCGESRENVKIESTISLSSGLYSFEKEPRQPGTEQD